MQAPATHRDFLQGLIHLAVGCLHRQRQNLNGASLQFGKAINRLESYPQEYEGVDVARVRSFLAEAQTALTDGAPGPEAPVLP